MKKPRKHKKITEAQIRQFANRLARANKAADKAARATNDLKSRLYDLQRLCTRLQGPRSSVIAADPPRWLRRADGA